MNGTGSGRERSFEDRLAIEIRLGESHRFVGFLHKGCVGVSVYVDRNATDPHRARAAKNTPRNFASICNE
jgi:hypothetical protein